MAHLSFLSSWRFGGFGKVKNLKTIARENPLFVRISHVQRSRQPSSVHLHANAAICIAPNVLVLGKRIAKVVTIPVLLLSVDTF